MRSSRDLTDTWNVTQATPSAALQWSVACVDPFGRWRGLTVVARGDDVLLVAPPGESAVLSVEQARELSRTLGRAAVANSFIRARPQ
jgi:hypothetical protein